mmetsp:Transcript_5700/g.9039  ORF Transcript_5700/g.9039 Transcript_5700/m.9039 type:complete len:243 (+) Transcript_5700:1082-1810(+)
MRSKSLKELKKVQENGDIDESSNKIVELILKGINILMTKSKQDLMVGSPHGAELNQLLEAEMNTLFKLTHHNVFRIQIQVFKLLFQFAKATQFMAKQSVSIKEEDENKLANFSDRFYRTLYELIFTIQLKSASNLDDFFGVIFRAIKADESLPRAIAFLKRLLQTALQNEPNYAAACLLIVSEILGARDDLKIHLFSFRPVSSGTKVDPATVKLDQAASDDSDEECFVDVDKVAAKKQEVVE